MAAIGEGVLQGCYYVPMDRPDTFISVSQNGGDIFSLRVEAGNQVLRERIESVVGLPENPGPEFFRNCIASLRDGTVCFTCEPREGGQQHVPEKVVAMLRQKLMEDYPVSQNLSEGNIDIIVQMLEFAFRAAGDDVKRQQIVAQIIADRVEGVVDEKPFEFIGEIEAPYLFGLDDAAVIVVVGAVARIIVAAIRARADRRRAQIEAQSRVEAARIAAAGGGHP